MRSVNIIILLVLLPALVWAQKPKRYHSADIQLGLKKLNILGTMLYVAAHPDDENTRMIAYYANEKLYNTAYLSATRGDGGQNLIGPEIREQLGVIRTQELLAARRTDGGQQFFSRANDFGYSKNREETYNIWDKDQVLADFVWTIRRFKPDVIITRFPASNIRNHGHHTASAYLANEAFDLAGDKKAYPEQLQYVDTWQPKRVFWNSSPFFYRFTGQKMDSTIFYQIDAGVYNPLKGKSYSEMAAESRTMHKSQGFGSTGTRGRSIEFLQLTKGDSVRADPFEDVNTTWSRVAGGAVVGGHVESAILNYDPDRPYLIVPDLIAAYQAMEQIEDEHWKKIKQREAAELIKACMGLFMEVRATDYAYTPGDSISLKVEAINRSPAEVVLQSLHFEAFEDELGLDQPLKNNMPFYIDRDYFLSEDTPYSQPYWLRNEGTLGMYRVDNQELIGRPENAPALEVKATIGLGGQSFTYRLPVIYKRNDPVGGELYRPLAITPPVFLNVEEKVYVFADNEPKPVRVVVKSGKEQLKGEVKLDLPAGWRSEPASIPFNLELKGEEETVVFNVFPSTDQSDQWVKVLAEVDGRSFDYSLVNIEYDHIPTQTLFLPARTKLVKIDLIKKGDYIGYIMGAGDEIPSSLEQIGYRVKLLEDGDITASQLADFDAVILGVRAYNTVQRLRFHQETLLNYVSNGGTMIVQYNTNRRLALDPIGPYPIKISRDRVSVEEAEIRVLEPDHPIVNTPNKITTADFQDWVQERGLYFANEWDDQYTPVFSANDPGEEAKDGGLLVARHGQGYFIYTGYSWFRQLPAGVPGAFRIFTNMISIGVGDGDTSPAKSSGKED